MSEFVKYLCSISDREDRGALAALRRGLGKPVGTVPETYPYIVPWLPAAGRECDQNAHFIIASLYALHPVHSDSSRSMGWTIHTTAAKRGESSSAERRFVAMLNAHVDDLPHHLRHAVSLARTEGVPVNYTQLLTDLGRWPDERRWVQKRWASDFWTPASKENDQTDKEK